jgi:hypothetical protein
MSNASALSFFIAARRTAGKSEVSMADNDSTIAWHRAQLKKHREVLRNMEVRRFRYGEIAEPRARAEKLRLTADLQRKITASERVIGAYEKRTRRPLTTDYRSLASVHWGTWNSAPCNGEPARG